MNQADSLRFEAGLAACGAERTSPESADVVVVNTCSVTASADQGARQTIRRVARMNPAVRIVATGCYATRAAGELAALPNVACVIGNEEKASIQDRALALFSPAIDVHHPGRLPLRFLDETRGGEKYGDGEGPCGDALAPGLMGRTAWTIRVQTGCEERCSYCIIPSTRGRSRSRSIDDLLTEIRDVVAHGFREIVLTGVHLGAYGRDLEPACTLSDLLHALASGIDGRVRFRVSSLEPMDCPPSLVDLVAGDDRFAPHFHLPLQHASDSVLAVMARPYTLSDYRRLVDDIRVRVPHAAIGSDIMAGFPGETDADHSRQVEYLRQSPLTHLHVFPYSDRPGTPASEMTGRVHGTTVRARAAELREISRDLTRRFHLSQVGVIRPALAIDAGDTVVTDNYLKVRISRRVPRNTPVHVRLAEVDGGLRGDIVHA